MPLAENLSLSRYQIRFSGVAILFAIGMALYPPWVFIGRHVGEGVVSETRQHVGYSWFFNPPFSNSAQGPAQINFEKLGDQLLVLLIIAASGAWFMILAKTPRFRRWLRKYFSGKRLPQYSVRTIIAFTVATAFVLALIQAFLSVFPHDQRKEVLSFSLAFFCPPVAGAIIGITVFRWRFKREWIGGLIGGATGSFVFSIILIRFQDLHATSMVVVIGACIGAILGAIFSLITPRALPN